MGGKNSRASQIKYRAKPEVLAHRNAEQRKERASPKGKARLKAYYARPETKRRKRAWNFGVKPHEMPFPPPDKTCECCGKVVAGELRFDHNHDLEALGFSISEAFRGWLCSNCNVGIGMLGDNIAGVTKALVYLEKRK